VNGLPIVISGPSGCGKTTLSKFILDSSSSMMESVSYTTRPPRMGEEDGVNYHFVSNDQFNDMIRSGGFLEWSEVHGFKYGTGAEWVREKLSNLKDLLFVLDISGGMQLKASIDAITILLVPPSIASLEERLVRRGTDDADVIARRMSSASTEISDGLKLYDYVVRNHRLESALYDILSIIRTEHIRRVDRKLINHYLLESP